MNVKRNLHTSDEVRLTLLDLFRLMFGRTLYGSGINVRVSSEREKPTITNGSIVEMMRHRAD